jgi:hypothetical protein
MYRVAELVKEQFGDKYTKEDLRMVARTFYLGYRAGTDSNQFIGDTQVAVFAAKLKRILEGNNV